MRRVVAHGTERIFDSILAGHSADDRQVRAIRRPVGFDDVVSNFARGPAGERNSSQRAAAAAAIAVKQHGQLRRLGDAEEFSVLDAQRAGLRSLAVGHVDFGGLTVPCRAVDDGVAVGSETGATDLAATKCHAMEGDLARGAMDARREIPASECRTADGDGIEQGQKQRRDARFGRRNSDRPCPRLCRQARHRRSDRRRGRMHRRGRRSAYRRRAQCRLSRFQRRHRPRNPGHRSDGRECRKRLQVERQVARRLKSLIAILLQASPHQLLQLRRNVRQCFGKIGRIFFEDRAQRLDR